MLSLLLFAICILSQNSIIIAYCSLSNVFYDIFDLLPQKLIYYATDSLVASGHESNTVCYRVSIGFSLHFYKDESN